MWGGQLSEQVAVLDVYHMPCAGEPWEIKKAVCLHEEDAGILWKHMEYRNGHAEVRRSRRLVLSFVATVVNYEYCFYWHFYQVGSPFSFSLSLCNALC